MKKATCRWCIARVCRLAPAAFLAACALTAPPTHTDVVRQALPATTQLPQAWRAGADTGAVPGVWIATFKDPQLGAIVAEAMTNNTDLRSAAARVEIAQQSVIVVGAGMLPQVGAQLGARSTYDRDAGSAHTSSVGYVGVAWEIDVWGRLRAQRESADYGAQAAALDYAWSRESLAALVAKSWYLCIETRQLLALAQQSVQVYAELLKLVNIRRNAGKDSDLNVADVTAKLDTARSSVEVARQSYGEARRALETLLGRYPASEIEVAAVFGFLPPPAGAGLPSSLLERRADLIAAERVVFAAFRQQESAQLALLPSFGLSFAGGRFADIVTSLLRMNPWLASAAVGMSIPIYEGGALKAQVAIATAQQAEAVARYGSVALNAFREVEDSLANEQLLAARLPLEESALNARSEAVRIATQQFVAGRQDLLWVAQLQTAQISTESNLIRLRSAQRANRIRLYQALGGGFEGGAERAPKQATL
jgi:NodT family efflux transporter outer membrane factor (OMF) lipoprotein